MSKIWDLAIAALIGAVVSGTVDLVFEHLKGEFNGKSLIEIIRNIWWRIILYIGIGLTVGLLGWSLIDPLYQKPLFMFDQSTQSWEPLLNPTDAAIKTSWDLSAKALRAEYNFAQTDPNNPRARATFYYDNFNDTWLGYRTFNLDITNPNPQQLEVTFSVDIDGCFYEFGNYRNLSPGESTLVNFNFTEPKFKTCKSPTVFDQTLDPAKNINRIYLIIGTNESPADFDGNILIDNVRLQKDVWFFRIALGIVVLAIVCLIAFIEYRYQKHFS